MASESRDALREQPEASLEKAVAAIERRLDALAPEAKPEAAAPALDGVLAPLASTAREVLR